jgi:hypothetical protein
MQDLVTLATRIVDRGSKEEINQVVDWLGEILPGIKEEL